MNKDKTKTKPKKAYKDPVSMLNDGGNMKNIMKTFTYNVINREQVKEVLDKQKMISWRLI